MVGLLVECALDRQLTRCRSRYGGLNFTCSVSDCFGLNVTGKLLPEKLKPAPEIAAEFTVTEEVPVEVRVTLRVNGEPIVTVPKLTLVGETSGRDWMTDAAVPVIGMYTVGLLLELLLIVN